MSVEYETACRKYDDLKDARGFASEALLPRGGRLFTVGPAIDSETLAVHLVLFDPDTGNFRATSPHATRPGDDIPQFADRFRETLRPIGLRHRKGGLYTRFCEVEAAQGPHVLYVSHQTGIAWLRPREHFTRDRFLEIEAPVLDPGDIWEV